jgi:hypothetical protein
MPASLLNNGVIVVRPPNTAPRTLIVTGTHRSGTSLVAAMLQRAGIFMGSEINDIVYEDEELDRILRSGDPATLQQFIASRNTAHRVWGFKLPMLCRDLPYERLGWFTNPHLIVTFRDLVAMAVRASVSEFQDPAASLRRAAADQGAMLTFVDTSGCPALLLSYEKALMMPEQMIDAVMRFCGIPLDASICADLVSIVEPGRERYVAGARRRFEGTVERIQGDVLCGWCWLTQSNDPVTLEIFADDRFVARVIADVLRGDLLAAGIGEGRHGFAIPLQSIAGSRDAVIRVRVAGHDVDVPNSGKRLCDYAGSA